MRQISDFILYIFFLIIFYLIKILPYSFSSNFFGKILKVVGPFTSVTKVAYRNLDFAFPSMEKSKKDSIVKKMWENVGRMVGEFPHVSSLKNSQIEKIVEIKGQDVLRRLQKEKKPTIIVTAHFGNWEMAARKLRDLHFDISVIYRKMNNKFIDKVVCNERDSIGISQIPKSTSALKMLLDDLSKNKFICLLSDQKQNTGIESYLFGHKAMTGTLPAKIALKKNVTLVPLMVTRKSNIPSHFNVNIGTPIDVQQDDSVESLTQKINHLQEDWIKKYPEEWFWLHKRWPKEKYINH